MTKIAAKGDHPELDAALRKLEEARETIESLTAASKPKTAKAPQPEPPLLTEVKARRSRAKAGESKTESADFGKGVRRHTPASTQPSISLEKSEKAASPGTRPKAESSATSGRPGPSAPRRRRSPNQPPQ